MVTRPNDIEYARELDAQDILASFRGRFVIDDEALIYVDGNSLGRLPKESEEVVHQIVHHEWGSRLIRSWNEGWYTMPERVGGKVASLLGARPDEVIMADSTSVNLFKLALAAVRANPARTKIVTDDLNFPSDLYILDSVCQLAGPGYQVEIVPSADGIHGPVELLARAIDEQTALVSLSHTVFKSGFTYPMAAITQMAHEAGALALWDTSHSVGTRPIMLDEAGVDMAVGCSYKYLNGGPGAPAFLYINIPLQEKLVNPISGWMGQRNPFGFDLEYRPVDGLRGFLTGTPPILSLAAVETGVDLLVEAGLENLRAKSEAQTQYLIGLWEDQLRPLGFRLNSPVEAAERGSHVSLGHEGGFGINRALIEEMKVLPDFREPDNIRIGLAPLYNSFEEIYRVVKAMKQIVEERLFTKYRSMREVVT